MIFFPIYLKKINGFELKYVFISSTPTTLQFTNGKQILGTWDFAPHEFSKTKTHSNGKWREWGRSLIKFVVV